MQALTLRNDEADELEAADTAGDAGFPRAASWGEPPSPPSSRALLRPVIEAGAHGRMRRGRAGNGGTCVVQAGGGRASPARLYALKAEI